MVSHAHTRTPFHSSVVCFLRGNLFASFRMLSVRLSTTRARGTLGFAQGDTIKYEK